ncbi:MAG: ATP-binding cassette domain-containing protein [Dyadobacter sp.]|uniref:sulfate/molybdate ABC transporter ATP-binding protein n=1 Tax=Dyadobacter sp. TaxID=1914288 RepID=UPI003263EDF0
MSDNLLDINIRHSLQTANGILPMEVTFSLSKGNILALTGPSGAGKTTLLRQIAGLVNPQSGKISLNQQLWLDTSQNIQVPARKRNIGFVFQDYSLFPHMTVQENLLFALEKKGDEKVTDELLEAMELTQLSGRKPHQLSGGQQQRVALARALVRKPDLLLLDEPFAALDHSMRYQLQNLLLKFHRLYQFTVMIVTHDIGEMFRLADRVMIMNHGKITQSGSPAEVYTSETDDVGDFTLFGEVLSCQKLDGHLLVSALIENKVRQLSLSLDMEPQMLPGNNFTLPYSLEPGRIRLVNNR